MVVLAIALTVLALVFTFMGLHQVAESPITGIYATAQGVVMGYLAYLAFTGSSFTHVTGLFLLGFALTMVITTAWCALDDDGAATVAFSAIVAILAALGSYALLT